MPEEVGWGVKALVPILLVSSMPFVQTMTHGQNSCMSLLILTGSVTLWRKAAREGGDVHGVLAGMVAGLLLYKPQLGAVVGLVMVVTLGWRALAGFAFTGVVLLGVTWLTMPGGLEALIERSPGNLRQWQEAQPYFWERHVTFKGFWRLLVQGQRPGPTSAAVKVFWGLSVLGLGAALASAVQRTTSRKRSPRQVDRLIAAAVACMPLLMPYYFDYDLLLLAVPAVLLAGERCAGPVEKHGDGWLIRCWVALYIALMVSSGLGRVTHVQIAVVLLAATAVMQVARALRLEEPALGAEMAAPAEAEEARLAA
jgi:hypothetical protein